MRGADLQAGEAVERALEDQVRQRDRGLQRVADGVGQQAAAAEPAAGLQLARAERVHEDQHAELLALRPEGMEARVGQLLAGDAAADADAAEAELLDRVLDLLGGQLGMLQRGGREGDEAVGIGGAELDQRLVLDLDQLGRDVALGAVPVWVDAERLDVDALRVHRRDARAGVVHQQARRLERMLDQRHRLGHAAMGVHVDGLDPLAVDHDLAAARMGMPVGVGRGAEPGGCAQHLAAGEGDGARRRAGHHVPGQRHCHLPLISLRSSTSLQRLDRRVASATMTAPVHPRGPSHGRP